MPSHGELIDSWQQGPVLIEVRYGCTLRDVYELRSSPLPASLQRALAQQGALRGGPQLYVVDVAETHQLTVAASAGRIVVMPRQRASRPAQRAAVEALVQVVVEHLAHAQDA